MALYTNTLTCTWAELQTALSGTGTLTSNTSITVSDPANVVLGSYDTSGTLGYLIKSYTGSYLLDFIPSDFSTSTYTANSTSLFNNCTKLSGMCKLPSSITSASNMFIGCTGLTSIDTSGFTKVTNAYSMFSDCTSLTSIDTTGFTNVTNADGMFADCTGLTSIDTSAFKNLTSASGMFFGRTSLKSIYMYDCKFNYSSEPTSNNNFMTSIQTDCMFYVAPDSYDTWYSRLYTQYSYWGLSAAKTPTLNKVYIYRRIA